MRKQRIIGFFMCVVLLITGVTPVTVHSAVYTVKKTRQLTVDGATSEIKTLDYYYADNIYVSLKDVAAALKNTNKSFNVDLSEGISIESGVAYDGDAYGWSVNENNTSFRMDTVRRIFSVNGMLRTYHAGELDVLKGAVDNSSDLDNSDSDEKGESEKDIFIKPIDLAMMLDISVDMENGALTVDTGRNFDMTCDDLEEGGYCESLNTLLVGDATTGEIFYGYEEDKEFFIASTTKLMTYYVVMDAVKAGRISLEDEFSVTRNGAELSLGNDAVLSLSEGQKVTVSELLCAMLIPSSNESALTLAEGVAGSHEEFVALMNKKAEELELTHSYFYNCHGLPYYNDDLIPAKIQNHMSSEDMFTLVSGVLRDHPEILQITSTKEMTLPTIGKEIKNSNHLLYNIDGVNGLKTGTTNKSGTCLVASATVNKDGVDHNIVTVMFGEEGDEDRVRACEVAMRYGIREVYGNSGDYEGVAKAIPRNPEKVMKRLMLKAMK